MKKLKSVLLTIAAAVVLIAVIAGVWFWRSTQAPVPSAFYTPPNPLPAGEPGTIIRTEPITSNLPEGAVGWRMLYLSNGLNGEPVAVSGVVIAPEGDSQTPRPVIAWAHGTLGVLPECGTSHTEKPFSHIPAVELMVREGFVIVATDYPGRGTPGVHPYLVGLVEASSVLDSVRAARQLEVNAGDQYAIWGASQGGHSALWAAQSAASYMPELALMGVAASAPAVDLESIFESGLDRRGGAIVISEALYAWSHIYTDITLDAVVKPELRDRFETVAKTCVTTPTAFLVQGTLPTPSEFFTVDPLITEPFRSILQDNIPQGPIDVPLLISHGTADMLIPIEGSIAEAARRCEAGEDVQFVRYPGVEHPAAEQSGIMTVGWIEDRFAGRPTGPTCGGQNTGQ